MHYECLSSIEDNKNCEIVKLIKVFLKTSETTKTFVLWAARFEREEGVDRSFK